MKSYQSIVLLLVFIISSCHEQVIKNESKDSIIKNDTAIATLIDKVELNEIESELSVLLNSINVDTLKIKYGRNCTSGIVSKKQNPHFKTTNDSSFFGVYFFPNETLNNGQPLNLKLIIQSNSKHWEFSDKGEQLVEITNYSKSIEIFPVKIGDSITKANKYFSTPIKKLESEIFYFEDSNGIIISMKVEDAVITKIRIGRYNYSKIDEIEQLLVSTFKY